MQVLIDERKARLIPNGDTGALFPAPPLLGAIFDGFCIGLVDLDGTDRGCILWIGNLI